MIGAVFILAAVMNSKMLSKKVSENGMKLI